MLNSMKTTEPVLKGKKRKAGTVVAGVERKQPYFIPGRGTVEAKSIEEAIKQPTNETEEVTHDNS